jgi:hypothetical protein
MVALIEPPAFVQSNDSASHLGNPGLSCVGFDRVNFRIGATLLKNGAQTQGKTVLKSCGDGGR